MIMRKRALTASEAGLPAATVLTLASGRSGQVSGRSKPLAALDVEAPLLRPLADDPFDVPFGRGSEADVAVDSKDPPPPDEKAPSSADAKRRTTSLRSFLSRASAARACRIEYCCQLCRLGLSSAESWVANASRVKGVWSIASLLECSSVGVISLRSQTHHINVASGVSLGVDERCVRVRIVLLSAFPAGVEAYRSENVVQCIDLLLNVVLALHESARIFSRLAGVRLWVWERELDILVRFGNGHGRQWSEWCDTQNTGGLVTDGYRYR